MSKPKSKKHSRKKSKAVKRAKSAKKLNSMPTQPGNYIDTFVKSMFGWVMVFADFLLHYGDEDFVSQLDLKKIKPAPTHYIGKKGDERIADLVFLCPLKNSKSNAMAVIVFEHQGRSLKYIVQKLLRYISAIWDAELKEGKTVLSAPYFIVLRTGKKPYRGRKPTLSDLLPKGPDGKPIGKAITLDYDIVDVPAWTWDMLRGGPVLRLTFGMLKAMLEGEGDGTELPVAMLPILEIPDEEVRIDLSKISLDFAALAMAAHNGRLDEAMVHEALKPIFKDKERFMIATIFQEREAIGEARGEARGVTIGEARGEARGVTIGEARGRVLAILQFRFPKIPKATENAIRSMVDVTALESLAVQAKTCKSLADFAKALK